MTSRLVFRGFAVFGALIFVAVLAVTAGAQPAPVRVVQGSDGTLYVLQGSTSWTLVPDQISDADVAALAPVGEIDGSLPSEVLMAQAPEASPAAAPAPPAAEPPAPAPAPAAPAPAAPPAAPVASAPPQLVIQNPAENQLITAKGGASFTITGTATDPVAGPGGIDRVDVWIFGERNTNGASDLGNATLLSDGSWSLVFLPTRFVSTHTNIYVYVHSKVTGLESVGSRGFNIVG
jgi:Bacterial Ig domain